MWLALKPEAESNQVRYWSWDGKAEAVADHPVRSLEKKDVVKRAVGLEADKQQIPADRVFALSITAERGQFLGVIVVAEPDWLATAPLPDKTEVTLLQQVEATGGKILTQAIQREMATDDLGRLIRQLELANDLLEHAHARYTSITKFARVGIFEANRDGVTQYINEAGKDMEEMTDDERPDDWRNHLHPDHREEIERSWDDFVRQSQAGTGPEYYEIDEVFQTKDGVDRVFAVRAQARRRNGQLDSFVGALTDVTAIREQDQVLKIRLGEINHDIRNGLSGLETPSTAYV